MNADGIEKGANKTLHMQAGQPDRHLNHPSKHVNICLKNLVIRSSESTRPIKHTGKALCTLIQYKKTTKGSNSRFSVIERYLNAQIFAQINNYIINKSDLYFYILFLGIY